MANTLGNFRLKLPLPWSGDLDRQRKAFRISGLSHCQRSTIGGLSLVKQ